MQPLDKNPLNGSSLKNPETQSYGNSILRNKLLLVKYKPGGKKP